MFLRQYQEHYVRETKDYLESKVNQITREYEEQLKIATEQKEHAQQELVTIKLEVEKALQRLYDLYQEVNHERKQKDNSLP